MQKRRKFSSDPLYVFGGEKERKGGKKIMAMKKSMWDMILKVVIAVASAVAGVFGANAMNL